MNWIIASNIFYTPIILALAILFLIGIYKKRKTNKKKAEQEETIRKAEEECAQEERKIDDLLAGIKTRLSERKLLFSCSDFEDSSPHYIKVCRTKPNSFGAYLEVTIKFPTIYEMQPGLNICIRYEDYAHQTQFSEVTGQYRRILEDSVLPQKYIQWTELMKSDMAKLAWYITEAFFNHEKQLKTTEPFFLALLGLTVEIKGKLKLLENAILPKKSLKE